MTPGEFILARVADDEAVARECAGVPWVMLEGVGASQVLVDPAVIRDAKWRYGRLGHVATTSHDGSYAAHIAAHDPARAIAQCAAYRAIVEGCVESQYQWILGRLATIWADHPDFNPEWAM